LENARTIIIWGKNPAETNIQEIAFISKAREKGCRVIVIDTLRTPTADKADMLISPRPGTDAALALAVAGILVSEGLVDDKFIAANVHGYEEFRNSLKITSQDAEKITGVPDAVIIELARTIGTGSPVTFLPGYGLQRHQNGGQTIRSILSLAVLTGNIGKQGAGFNYANLQSYVFDQLKEPESYYPDPENDFPFRRIISMARLGNDMLKAADPVLKASWIERGNPLLQSPDSSRVKLAFSKMEFRVVVEQFMTDTAAVADLILPAKDIFEQSDIIGSYWSPYVQYKPAVIKSPGEVMPESEIYYKLASRLDMNISSSLIPEPGEENIQLWLEQRIKGYSELSLKDLKNGPVLAPGLKEIAWDDFRFSTPSRKIELYSEEANKKWGVSELPAYDPIATEEDIEAWPLVFITPNTGSRIHSQFGNLRIIMDTALEPAVSISPADAEKRKILNGNQIRIYNPSGEIISKARISNRVPEGIVVLPNGIWYDEGGGGNHLIAGRETDMGYGAAFHDNRVQIEKIG